MQSQNKFPKVLRRLLTAIGLSLEAVDEIVERIEDFLSGEKDEKAPHKSDYPYCFQINPLVE
jgi:hypothetical protein